MHLRFDLFNEIVAVFHSSAKVFIHYATKYKSLPGLINCHDFLFTSNTANSSNVARFFYCWPQSRKRFVVHCVNNVPITGAESKI